jgi:hypothetical protein
VSRVLSFPRTSTPIEIICWIPAAQYKAVFRIACTDYIALAEIAEIVAAKITGFGHFVGTAFAALMLIHGFRTSDFNNLVTQRHDVFAHDPNAGQRL